MVVSTLQAPALQSSVVQASVRPSAPIAAVSSIKRFLAEYGVGENLRDRVAVAIVNSSRKYNIDPRLVASVIVVESRANPFAVSGADAVGIMQIHLPTWGNVAEQQGINLFKIEDNVDLGVRILTGYIAQRGLWEGVMSYNGFTTDPASQQAATDYVQRVRKIYGTESKLQPPPPPASQASLR
jgi:soluble lytic murein transglycosylase-like protein